MTKAEYAELLDNFYDFIYALEDIYPEIIDELDASVASAIQQTINIANTGKLNRVIKVLGDENERSDWWNFNNDFAIVYYSKRFNYELILWI